MWCFEVWYFVYGVFIKEVFFLGWEDFYFVEFCVFFEECYFGDVVVVVVIEVVEFEYSEYF